MGYDEIVVEKVTRPWNIVGFWFVSYVGYRALQGVTGVMEDYMELQGVTCKGYLELQGITGGYRWFTGGNRGLQSITGGHKDYKGLQGITGAYREFQGLTRGYR